MRVNIDRIVSMLNKRSDGGAAKEFLEKVPLYIKEVFFGNEKAECKIKKVLHKNGLFWDIKQNGVKKPIIFYWDSCGFEIDGYHRLACLIALNEKFIEARFKVGILLIMAHPDDEIIFGWPVMQDTSIKKSILICSSDLYNKRRSSVKERKKIFAHICKKLQIDDFECFDYNSEFYKLETRRESLKKMIEKVGKYIQERSEGYRPIVYTHNALGDYGNIDHRLINYICSISAPHIMYSDILYQSNWLPVPKLKGLPKKLFFTNPIMRCHLNKEFYKEYSNLYKEKKCWTWDQPPKETCRIYLE